MCACEYACVYMCAHVCVRVCMCVCVYVCVCVRESEMPVTPPNSFNADCAKVTDTSKYLRPHTDTAGA